MKGAITKNVLKKKNILKKKGEGGKENFGSDDRQKRY